MRTIASQGRLLLALLVLLVATIPRANAADYPPHSGKSPTAFDDIEKPSDTYVVNDRDSSTLDRFLFRSGGTYDIEIPVSVTRNVGDLVKLAEKGLVSKTAKIFLPAFDIDATTEPVFDCDGDDIPDQFLPEVDEVYFNGELIGVLSGQNELWKFNDRFEVPIEKIRFSTGPGEPGENLIQIKVDVANKDVPMSSGAVGCKVWATEIDWAAIQFEATSPIIFVPGLSGSPASLTSSGYPSKVRSELGLPGEVISHSRFVPSVSACASGATPSYDRHAAEMRESVKEFAEAQGADSVHLVGHSKGGVDSRFFLKAIRDNPLKIKVGTMSGQPVYSDLKVSSLTTHGAMHGGTSIADWLVVATGGFGLPLLVSDLCDMTTQTMTRVNGKLPLPRDIPSLLIGADADRDGNGTISDSEAIGNQFGNPIANFTYRRILDYASWEVEYYEDQDPITGADVTRTRPNGIPNIQPQPNDTLVSVQSATALPGASAIIARRSFGAKNHGTIIDADVQADVIERGLSGVLDWRLH